MDKIKLLTVTWSNNEQFDITKEILYKSFKLYNRGIDIVHHHFYDNDYLDLKNEYNNRFGVQSEYILYKVIQLKKVIENIDSEHIIFCDATDVTCTSSIDHLLQVFDLERYVIIGHEKNQWPTKELKSSWPNYEDYRDYDSTNQTYLNSGVILAKKENFIKLLDNLNDKILVMNNKFYHNDQGVFTHYYNTFNKTDNLVKLDYSSLMVVNTYIRSHEEYQKSFENISCNFNGIKPCFVHDNGYNYGSPKYREHFRLKCVYD